MVFLSFAILLEVVATTLLPFTQGFTKLAPSLGCLGGYAGSFYFLSLATAAGMSSATAYAIWCGAGIVLIVLLQALLGNTPNLTTLAGIVLICGGVTLINLAGGAGH